jgi:Gas vesicle protein
MSEALAASRANGSGGGLAQPVALVDLLDRVLATGVVITGEVTLSLAGVDLVYVSLRALLTSIRPGLVPVEPVAGDVGGFVDGAVAGAEPVR